MQKSWFENEWYMYGTFHRLHLILGKFPLKFSMKFNAISLSLINQTVQRYFINLPNKMTIRNSHHHQLQCWMIAISAVTLTLTATSLLNKVAVVINGFRLGSVHLFNSRATLGLSVANHFLNHLCQ